MKQKFLKDLGIDIDEETDDLLRQFDLNGFLDQISDNRIKEEAECTAKIAELQKREKKVEELQGKDKNNK